jgi:hypothetical protein
MSHDEAWRPVVFQPDTGIGRVAEDIVADIEIRGNCGVLVRQEVAAIRIGSLVVAPAKAGVEASVVFEVNIRRS